MKISGNTSILLPLVYFSGSSSMHITIYFLSAIVPSCLADVISFIGNNRITYRKAYDICPNCPKADCCLVFILIVYVQFKMSYRYLDF